jgi:hypothetical protein
MIILQQAQLPCQTIKSEIHLWFTRTAALQTRATLLTEDETSFYANHRSKQVHSFAA